MRTPSFSFFQDLSAVYTGAFNARRNTKQARSPKDKPKGRARVVTSPASLACSDEGEVTPAGDVTIFMHSERADSTRLATINLSGTVHEGVPEADGKFLGGRSASINWHLAPSSAR